MSPRLRILVWPVVVLLWRWWIRSRWSRWLLRHRLVAGWCTRGWTAAWLALLRVRSVLWVSAWRSCTIASIRIVGIRGSIGTEEGIIMISSGHLNPCPGSVNSLLCIVWRVHWPVLLWWREGSSLAAWRWWRRILSRWILLWSVLRIARLIRIWHTWSREDSARNSVSQCGWDIQHPWDTSTNVHANDNKLNKVLILE